MYIKGSQKLEENSTKIPLTGKQAGPGLYLDTVEDRDCGHSIIWIDDMYLLHWFTPEGQIFTCIKAEFRNGVPCLIPAPAGSQFIITNCPED
jgi:hypothetical protein